jgi:hypothetical protein
LPFAVVITSAIKLIASPTRPTPVGDVLALTDRCIKTAELFLTYDAV